jgi:hypothetical protein
LWETALRETFEELGYNGVDLLLLGCLPPVHVNVSGYTISPFVAWSESVPALRPDRREVASVIEAPLAGIFDGQNVQTETWDFSGVARRVTFYRISGHVVWGATARVLAELASSVGFEPTHSHPGDVE